MPTDLHVIEELQTYLVAQGIGQLPSAAPSLTVPSIWLMPRDGAALPRNIAKDESGRWVGESTITLNDTMLRSPTGLEPWLEETFVDVVVRSPQPATGKLLQRAIHALIAPYDSLGGRKNWMMGALRVEYSTEWRGDQPLPQRQSVSESDPRTTYDRVQSFRIGCRRKILAGLTIP